MRDSGANLGSLMRRSGGVYRLAETTMGPVRQAIVRVYGRLNRTGFPRGSLVWVAPIPKADFPL